MGSTWTEDGKRRQAGSLVGWRRHDTCTPDRSGVVSHRPRHHVCPHPVTREPFSSWTASTSLHWAFQEEVASSDLGWTRRKGGNPLGSRREGKGGPPICIKLRTAELRIAQLLEGTRRVLPPVGPAIGSHRGTHPSQHHLPGHLASYRQNQPGHRPLDDLPRFEEASARVSPTALQGHPMLKKQAQELGVQLGQDALGLAASPRVYFAFLLPQLPQQFDLPAQAHERHDLSSREHVALDVGQHQQPLQLALFARTHLMARAKLACAGGGPPLAWVDVHIAEHPCCVDGVPPRAWLVSCVVEGPLQANAEQSSAPAPGPACPLVPTPRPPAHSPADCATTPSGSTAVLAYQQRAYPL